MLASDLCRKREQLPWEQQRSQNQKPPQSHEIRYSVWFLKSISCRKKWVILPTVGPSVKINHLFQTAKMPKNWFRNWPPQHLTPPKKLTNVSPKRDYLNMKLPLSPNHWNFSAKNHRSFFRGREVTRYPYLSSPPFHDRAAQIYTLAFSLIVCVGNLLMAEICSRVADAISFAARMVRKLPDSKGRRAKDGKEGHWINTN